VFVVYRHQVNKELTKEELVDLLTFLETVARKSGT
jgi:hypothetical protein